ncbi:hypothetical protein QWY28_07875 [Nocardioides sp. SOB77]|uniref:Flp pilus-assembly TadG-like N-terminal domain-containing protein n=1 Tax=Nocardioides oceani TaxID=3058369 RepID=A0ABT8FDU2_9ACTN|nr:hypothetical protein [Nocardioides oceani]MDN4172852.1 hypothetical protein [Nocardioides oceani]
MLRPGGRRRRRDERGAAAIIAAATALVLFAVAALAVDVGNTWARRGDLQQQADKAALFAAQYLPATNATSRKRVARAVAYYLVCNPVPGQRDVDQDGLPGATEAERQAMCGPGGDALIKSPVGGTALDTYATKLLDGTPGTYGAAVSFPSTTEVAVSTPAARIAYAFAPALGQGATDSVQRKTATARVSSPGDMLPMGMSLTCLAGVVNNAGLGSAVDRVLPVSYFSAGGNTAAPTIDNATEPVFPGWGVDYTGSNASTGVTIADPVVNGNLLTVDVGSPVLLPGLLDGLLGSVRVAFQRGSQVETASGSALTLLGSGLLTVALPNAVANTPGYWRVKVRLDTHSYIVVTSNPKWSAADVEVAIYPQEQGVLPNVGNLLRGVLDLDETLACGRVVDSPRWRDGKSPSLTHNIQEGTDHPLAMHPKVLQLLESPAAVTVLDSLLNGSASGLLAGLGQVTSNIPAALTGCTEDADSDLDSEANFDAGVVANCARTKDGGAVTIDEFTDGFLKDTAGSGGAPGYGRLHCSRGPCSSNTVSLSRFGFNGTFNNDSFSDFVNGTGSSLLSSQLAFALDTYLLPGLPLITPNDKLKTSIYRSPRFFWAPVLATVDLQNPAADYPILTFRPVFIDNGESAKLNLLGLDATKVADDLPGFVADVLSSVCDGFNLELTRVVCRTALSPIQASLAVLRTTGLLDVSNVLAAVEALIRAVDPSFATGDEVAGLVVREGELVAARFMTIAPEALPPVPQDYDGPETEYLGVGPKIIRLVE